MIEIQGVDPKMIAGDVESAYPTHPGSILNNCPQKVSCPTFWGSLQRGLSSVARCKTSRPQGSLQSAE